MFLPSPFYADHHDTMAERYRRVETLARTTGDLLPDLLTLSERGGSASPWECFIGSFIKFSLGPLVCASEAVAAACEDIRPDRIVAWDEPGEVSWWGGRQLVEDAAREASRISGAPIEFRSSSAARAARATVHPALARIQACRFFLRQMRPSPGALPGRHDVIISSLGQTIRCLAQRIGGALVERGLSVLMVELPDDPLQPRLTDSGLPHLNVYAMRDDALLRRSLSEIDASFDRQRAFAEQLSRDRDYPLSEPLRSALTRRMHNILASEMPRQIYHQALWRRVLDAARPRTLLTFNHYGTALAPGVLQANDRGVATVLCQHGMGGPHWRSTTLLPFDLVMTFGEFARDVLGSVAAPETQFAVTGHCGWDDLRAAPELRRPDGRGRPIVLATMQPVEQHLRSGEPRWWLRELALACHELGAELVIKPHPNETNTGDYEALAGELPEAVRFVAHGARPLQELIDECTVLATRYSTTAIEAIVAGKPVMTVFPTGAREHYPFAAEGAAVKVNACDELLPTLRALLSDRALHERLASHRKAFIDRHVGPLDGGATDRVVEHLLRLTETAAPNHDDI